MKNKSHSKSNINEVIHALTVMDTELLYSKLDKKRSYQDAPIEIFIERLENVFVRFRTMDTFLIPHQGKCHSSECSNTGKNGFSFIGNVSGNYLNLIIEKDDNENVTDLYQCNSFCPAAFELDDSKEEGYIQIYKDEKVTFIPNKAFEIYRSMKESSINDLQLFDGTTMPFEYIKLWKEKYDYLYSKVSGMFLINSFTLFKDYYRSFENLCKAVDLEKQAELAVSDYKVVSNSNREIDILKWIVKYENLDNNLSLYDDRNVYDVEKNAQIFAIHEGLNVFFHFKIIQYCLTFDKNFNNVYHKMLEKYNTLSYEEIMIMYTSKHEDFNLIYQVSYHLKKRGII